MAYTYRNRPSHSDVFRAVPLLKPASILCPFDPMPAAPTGPYTGPQLPPTEQELRRRDLANAEATLTGLMNALTVARAGIGEANRTHTAPVMDGSRVLMPAIRFSAARMRDRKSYAFRLFNRRRVEIVAARRCVDAARAVLGLSALAVVEERAATKAAVRASKRVPVPPIASAATA